MLAGAVGCKDERVWPEATQEAVEKAVTARMAELKHCWKKGEEKKSFLAGETQTFKVEINTQGRVRVRFSDAANDKHPVGACMRTALDGLRFAPREAPAQFDVPVRLGAPTR